MKDLKLNLKDLQSSRTTEDLFMSVGVIRNFDEGVLLPLPVQNLFYGLFPPPVVSTILETLPCVGEGLL